MSQKNLNKLKRYNSGIELIAIIITTFFLVSLAQKIGLLPIATLHFLKAIPIIGAIPLPQEAYFLWPLLAAFIAGIFSTSFSSKTQKVKITCRLGKLTWDRNSFCRGWLITGSTGSGKTEAGINKLLHQVFINEKGIEKPSWKNSLLEKQSQDFLNRNNEKLAPHISQIDKLREKLEKYRVQRNEILTEVLVEELAERETTDRADYEKQLNEVDEQLQDYLTAQSSQYKELQKFTRDNPNQIEDRNNAIYHAYDKTTENIQALEKRRSNLVEQLQGGQNLRTLNSRLAAVDNTIEECLQEILKIENEISPLREEVNEKIKQIEKARYEAFPWGGLCVDEKGGYWQVLADTAPTYKRNHHLKLLQTRPDWADKTWLPKARFNLLSDNRIPANTYASTIVTTANAVAGGGGDKGFFRTQAESQIGWAIDLCRAIRDAQLENGKKPMETFYPALDRILELLTVTKEVFWNKMKTLGTPPPSIAGEGSPKEQEMKSWPQPTLNSTKLQSCLDHFAYRYWSQPKDQLGGVQGTIYNYLCYFTGDDVAEVFCRDNTFSLEGMDNGMILCVAMPQKLQIERRYICTILKVLFYKHVLRRFDKRAGDFMNNNLLICWQDEWQRFAIEEDGNVDVIRSTSATTITATQMKPAVYRSLGGKENAKVVIDNLRNRLIFQSATLECATDSAEYLGKKETKKKSYSTGKSGKSYSYTPEIKYIMEPHQFMRLKKFHAVIIHCDAKWKKSLLEPIAPDGNQPIWYKRSLITSIKAILGNKPA